MKIKIAIIGAGSEEFGPASVHDIFLSNLLCKQELEVVLMDINEINLPVIQEYAEKVAIKLNRKAKIISTSSLDEALVDTNYVITAIELNRYHYWAQDFHVPRKYGFNQVYGENGGVGGIFHALRNIKSTLKIARKMEQICPNAWFLNYTNPLTKVCEAINRLSSIKFVGLCHGILAGKHQLGQFLEMDEEDLDVVASGLNHISWFQSIKDKNTGEDLYPKLKSKEKEAHWLAEWDEIALSRMLMRTYGLYPSPGANHIVEYIRWAGDFLASDKVQFFYDPNEGHPWETGKTPTWIYSLQGNPTQTPLYPKEDVNLVFELGKGDNREIKFSQEYAIPIIEGLSCGADNAIDAVNVPNNNFMPGIPNGAIVELPAIASKDGLQPKQDMKRLPEAVLAILRTQVSINQLLIEAFDEQSKNKLLQAILLEPTVNSYNNAVSCMNEMLALQKDVLPEFK